MSPGRTGASITLAHNVSFDGDNSSYKMATDKSGATYISWISSHDNNSGGLRVVHLCVIPSKAHACSGGVKTLDPTGDSTAAGLQLLVTPAGAVTILWIANTPGGSSIYYTTATKTGPLSAETTVATPLASNGVLLDAVPAPNGTIWLLAESKDSALQVRKGLTAAPVNVPLPHSWSFGAHAASLAFAGSTPIVVGVQAGGPVTGPVAYAYGKGSSWTAFKNVPNSGSYGSNVGLVHTHAGVRLITGDHKDFYFTALSKWTGHGFTAARKLGSLNLGSHDASTDPSGRLIDAGLNDDRITVLNFVDTLHPAAFSFALPASQTSVDNPAVTTSARGRGWVAWSYQGGNSPDGDTLVIAPIVLAGLHASKTVHGKHGRVTVTGPASCLPPVSISASVTAHPAGGWKVSARTLRLGSKKIGGSINGATLKAGKTYTLTGSVTFSRKGAHSSTSAKLRFRSCPNS